jgi:hypothetical protein
MRRLGLFCLIVVSAVGAECGRFSVPAPTTKSGPSLRELARSLSVPAGYVRGNAPAFFRRDNLYLAIDGMDSEYMAYGCVGMALLEWAKPKDAQEKIQAEISDMGTPLGAFGIYSRAHTGKGEFADMGEEAAVAEDALEFARGRFYVRLMGPTGARAQFEKLAREIVGRVPAGLGFETFVAPLPSEGRVARSERWIPESAFGMDFMRNVVAARYRVGDKEVELDLASFPDPATTREALDKFREKVKARSPQNVEGDWPAFVYTDEWLGRVGVFQVGNKLAVIVGYENTAAVGNLLKQVAASRGTSIGQTSQRP